MLILGRKAGETVIVGNDNEMKVTVENAHAGTVFLSVTWPGGRMVAPVPDGGDLYLPATGSIPEDSAVYIVESRPGVARLGFKVARDVLVVREELIGREVAA